MHILPSDASFVAEVAAVDLAAALPDAAIRALRAALQAHLLLVFRDQHLSPAGQVAFTRRLGTPKVHALPSARLPGTDEIVVEGAAGLGDGRWHADLAYTARPNHLSVLHAVPEDAVPGAVTLFADQREAHDRMDPWLAYHTQFLEAERDPTRRGSLAALPRVRHPVVRMDAATGRRSLFVDEDTTTRLVGPSETEGADLLHRLRAAATHPAVVYRHVWRPGDLVLWDNQAVLHRTDPPAAGRAWPLHRTMVSGQPPHGPAAVTQPWVSAG